MTVVTLTTTIAERLVRDRVRGALDARDGRLVVTPPPQEALKTTVAKAAAADELEQGRRVLYATYLHGLARSVDREMGERQRRFAGVGVGGAVTGFAAETLLIDDPLQPSATPADVEHAWEWLNTVALCRLGPGGSVVVFATRTGPDDFTGRLIAQGWPLLNLPALADGVAPDALDRPVGTYLPSLRGRTGEDWDKLRLLGGERLWLTQCQGIPPEADS